MEKDIDKLVKKLENITGLSKSEAEALLLANSGDINSAANMFLNSQVASPLGSTTIATSRSDSGSCHKMDDTYSHGNVSSLSGSPKLANILAAGDTPTASSKAPSVSLAKRTTSSPPFSPLETRHLKSSLNCRIPSDLSQLDLLHAR